MKKLVYGVLCIIMAVCIMAGCKRNETGETGKSGEKKDGKVTLVTSSNAEQMKGYKEIFDKFTEETGIKNNVMGVEYAQLYPKMQSMIAAGQTPEIVSWSTEFVPWAARGAMVPLDSYIEKSGFDTSIFNENMLDSLQWQDQQWELPISMGTCVLYYNIDLFEAAGVEPPSHDWNDDSWTLEAFLEMAQKLTLDNEGRNALDPDFDSEHIKQYGIGGMQSSWFYPWYGGGDWTDKEVTQYTGNDPKAIEAVQFVADLAHKYHVMPSAEQTEAMTAGGNIFMTGRVAMNIDGTWSCSTLKDAEFKWDMAATPKGEKHSIVLFTEGFGVGGKSEYPDAGWEFLNWLFTNEEYYMDYIEAFASYMTIPALKSVEDDVKAILKEQFPEVDVDVMFEAADCEDATPVYMRYHENFNAINTLITQEIVTPVMSGEITAEEAMTKAADKVQKLIDEKAE